MTVSAISKIYWRTIKRGTSTRTFDSIRDKTTKAEVKYLAQQDVINGVITAEEYEQYIGEEYTTDE